MSEQSDDVKQRESKIEEMEERIKAESKNSSEMSAQTSQKIKNLESHNEALQQ